jgi:hypothetical protein
MSANVEFEEELPGDVQVASLLTRKRLFLDSSTGEFAHKNSAGVVTPIGTGGGGDLTWTHNAVITNGTYPFGSPYTPAIYETVKTNPAGVAGVHVELPTPVGNTGKQIKVKNVTATANLGGGLGGDDVTSITTAAGNIDLGTDYVMDDSGESVVFESDGTDWLIVG